MQEKVTSAPSSRPPGAAARRRTGSAPGFKRQIFEALLSHRECRVHMRKHTDHGILDKIRCILSPRQTNRLHVSMASDGDYRGTCLTATQLIAGCTPTKTVFKAIKAHLTAERLARRLHFITMLTGTGSALYTASGARITRSQPDTHKKGFGVC